MPADTATLLIHCPDQPGLVHAVTGFILEHGGNILDLEQHIDHQDDVFFMRVEWSLEKFAIARDEIVARFAAARRSAGGCGGGSSSPANASASPSSSPRKATASTTFSRAMKPANCRWTSR